MNNLWVKAKFAFLIILTLFAVILVTVLIANFSGLISLEVFNGEHNPNEQDDLNRKNIDAAGLPNVFVGGSDGDIFVVRQGSRIKFLGSVENDIQDIERSGSEIFVATIKDNTESEEIGESSGRILKFRQEKQPFLTLDRVFASADQTIELGGQLLDLEATDDKIIAASHDHSSSYQDDGETLFEGKISMLSKADLDLEDEIGLEGASRIKIYNNSILGYGIGPKALIIDKENFKLRGEIEIEGDILGAEKHGEFYYFTSSRDYVQEGVPNPPTVTHGYVSKHSKNGEEIKSIDTGITSRPKEIIALEEDELILNDHADKQIKFADFKQGQITDTIKLEEGPEHLTISGNKAYAVGSDEDLLYVINLETRTLVKEIKIEGISSLSNY